MIKTPAYIHFHQPGMMTSVQDWARYDMVYFGVPYSGVMDRISMTLVNHLLHNPENAAVLEMAHVGPKMIFEMPTRIVFAGAEADIYINERSIKLGKVYDVGEDAVVEVKKFRRRQWLYMGVQGGLESEMVGKSRSWYPGVTPRDKMVKGDTITYLYEERYYPPENSHSKIKANWYKESIIKVFEGPEWDQLPKLAINRILNRSFTVSEQINRMAYQLEETIENDIQPILTSPVYPGTVQLTPSGKLIILMRDAQVTGGYPRILQVDMHSMNILAQKRSGEKIKFSIIVDE
ncbi:biotin-dependent carboxyltransferase family protein [Aquiflexum sp.]|uniref:5-oxoprolinase subunit C family protein n=1 Tax=Aquiflexum sp. TaxID=1872584 RepID=UPI0035945E81